MGAIFSGRREITENDLVDLHNKVVIVTGGYSGIGYGTVQYLVRKGAKVYLATRNEKGTKEAMERLEQEGIGDGSLHWLKLNLEDPHSVKRAAEEFLTKEERLDILVNNAAKGFGPFNLTKDGLRDIMVTNHLGNFILKENLLPLMKTTSQEEGSDVRIINLTSSAHSGVQPTSFVGKDNFNKSYGSSLVEDLRTYGLSKLANILHIKHLQRRLESENSSILCIAIDPGAVNTPNAENTPKNRSFIVKMLWGFMFYIIGVPIRQGAMNSVYAAASPEVRAGAERFKGAILTPVGKIQPGSPQARDERLADELYNTTLEILKELNVKVDGVEL